MSAATSFDQLLDAVQRLKPEDQAEFVALLQRRLAAAGRRQIAQDVKDARAEYASGGCAPAGVDDLMRDIES
jgi:hypothetical protein